jgi:hypothetical protein
MQDTKLFAQILGISEPWFVAAVDLAPHLGLLFLYSSSLPESSGRGYAGAYVT